MGGQPHHKSKPTRSQKKRVEKAAPPTLKESVGSRTRGTRLKKLGGTPKDAINKAVDKLADEGKDITAAARHPGPWLGIPFTAGHTVGLPSGG
jgi:hypothetical protein